MHVRLPSSSAGLFAVMVSSFAALPAAAQISPAPAFNAERLSTLPRDEWITNGGTLANQRYSPLTLLHRGNVAGLKGKWRTSMGSGANPGNSGQAQILVYDGVLYVINGDNDVFAIDVDSGEILWRYRGAPDPRAGNPFGRSSRGVRGAGESAEPENWHRNAAGTRTWPASVGQNLPARAPAVVLTSRRARTPRRTRDVHPTCATPEETRP